MVLTLTIGYCQKITGTAAVAITQSGDGLKILKVKEVKRAGREAAQVAINAAVDGLEFESAKLCCWQGEELPILPNGIYRKYAYKKAWDRIALGLAKAHGDSKIKGAGLKAKAALQQLNSLDESNPSPLLVALSLAVWGVKLPDSYRLESIPFGLVPPSLSGYVDPWNGNPRGKSRFGGY